MLRTTIEQLSTIELHNAGMPIRILMMPNIPGKNMVEKKEYCEENCDWIRRMLIFEPRGGSNYYGIIVTSPSLDSADFGILYMDTAGWHDMCGHASIGFASYAIEHKLIKVVDDRPEVVFDTPAGIIHLLADLDKGTIKQMRMINVPSFVMQTKKTNLRKYGNINVTIAFGGDFYGVVDMDELHLKWKPEILPELMDITREIFDVFKNEQPVHPLDRNLKGLYGVRFSQKVSKNPLQYYGILIFGSPERLIIDRSPSGTSSSAHLAYLYNLGKINTQMDVEFLSAIGTKFTGSIQKTLKVGNYDAIVPEIRTSDKGHHLTGFATWIVDPEDSLGEGFLPLQ
ncbi:MAG: proline racemase family protein [bacterium]